MPSAIMSIQDIVEKLGTVATIHNLTLATAESCTGGMIGERITSVPGASQYYLGGVIAYHNDVKIKVLNVKKETIGTYGAVSEECAAEMARGAAELFNAEVAVATTGIAGPGGGTKEKPVGLVYISYFLLGEVSVERLVFHGNRSEIRNAATEHAIRTLERKIVYTLKL